jgi:hypothetical protein
MFVYALAKGVRLGYLDNSFLSAIEKGYNGLIKTFISGSSSSVTIKNICETAGLGDFEGQRRDGSFEYYMSERIVENDGKGVGPFILAGLEVSKLGTSSIQKNSVTGPLDVNYQMIVNKSTIQINYTNPNEKQIEYRLFDLSGNLLRIQRITPASQNRHVTIERDAFTGGVHVHSIFVNGKMVCASMSSL